MTMGNRISKARKDKGYTQEYVASALGVSRQAVFKWEKDQTHPDTENLIALAKLLEVTVDYLANGVAEKQKSDVLGSGLPFQIASLIPLLILPLCWIIGVFSGEYTDMVMIPIDSGTRIGIPFLMYGRSPVAIALVVVSIVSLILFVLLLFLGNYFNKHKK